MGDLHNTPKHDNDDGGSLEKPWDRQPSIFEFVRSHIPEGEPGLDEQGYDLPDEDRVAQGSKVRWAPGAMDGVTTHHMGKGDHEEAVKKAVELTLMYAKQPTAMNKAALYEHLVEQHVVSIIDPLMEALAKEKGLNHERLYELARSLVTESADREPVKFGIAILGRFREPGDQELFQTLGRHDEFTLFCAVAIQSFSGQDDVALWTLARNATGWGRIHAVERLSHTTNSSIKAWLLREGFRNSVMNEYLAATCARSGGLLVALSQDTVDRELLTAAGEIIGALIAGGPAEGIDDYEDARPVLQSYLGHMAESAETPGDFLHINRINDYLGEEDSRWAKRYELGWSAEARQSLRSLCRTILGQSEWRRRVLAKLCSEDEVEFAQADQAAKALGIDTWDIHWRRLTQQPANSTRWYNVMAWCDEDHIGEVLDFAKKHLDLRAIATGAADELGLGPGFEQHRCLDDVLQALSRFPGRGATFIQAGLKSPVVRNRNLALTALAAWPREQWPKELETMLSQAAEGEPHNGVREQMQKALRGEPLSS